MKLIYYIILRITLALTLILTIWAVFFYVTMITSILFMPKSKIFVKS